jgi:hypothetical protein
MFVVKSFVIQIKGQSKDLSIVIVKQFEISYKWKQQLGPEGVRTNAGIVRLLVRRVNHSATPPLKYCLIEDL